MEVSKFKPKKMDSIRLLIPLCPSGPFTYETSTTLKQTVGGGVISLMDVEKREM